MNGRYRETDPTQVVSDNLSSDQLNVQTARFQPFVGVTFRFGSNPFTSSGGDNAGKTDSGDAQKGQEKELTTDFAD